MKDKKERHYKTSFGDVWTDANGHIHIPTGVQGKDLDRLNDELKELKDTEEALESDLFTD